jgi:hypothetical protein
MMKKKQHEFFSLHNQTKENKEQQVDMNKNGSLTHV